MVARIDSMLPPEMLERVLHLLPPRDLRAAVQVCRRWREVAEAPRLWTWVRLKVTARNIDRFKDILGVRRLQAVRRVEARAVAKVTKEMVKAELVGEAVAALVEAELCTTQLNTQQVDAMFRRLTTGGSRLSKLNLVNSCLEGVKPGLLARALAGLKVGLVKVWSAADASFHS